MGEFRRLVDEIPEQSQILPFTTMTEEDHFLFLTINYYLEISLSL